MPTEDGITGPGGKANYTYDPGEMITNPGTLNFNLGPVAAVGGLYRLEFECDLTQTIDDITSFTAVYTTPDGGSVEAGMSLTGNAGGFDASGVIECAVEGDGTVAVTVVFSASDGSVHPRATLTRIL